MVTTMGKMKTRLDWSNYEVLCLRRLKYIPTRNAQLSKAELIALGFTEAARSFGHWGDR